MNNLEEIAKVIRRSRRFFLCGHVNPDGDSIGSVLALGLALESLGKEVIMASPESVPENLTFLPSTERIKTSYFKDCNIETFIMLDCSGPDRLGDEVYSITRSAQEIIVLDHHPTSKCRADYFYINEYAAATGELVYDLLDLLEVTFTSDISVCLYTAIVTDTGSFQYQNTTPETHRRAARLLISGVDVADVNTKLYAQRPLEYLRVLGAALKTLRISTCGQVAWLSVTKDMLDELGVTNEYHEGLINYPRTIKGVEVALLFQEYKPGAFKISFRSKEKINVNEIACVFGGGGHVRASGCRIEGKFSEVENRILSEVYKAIRRNET